MQVKLSVGKWVDHIVGIDDIDLDEFETILPKHIDITTLNSLDINKLKDAFELFDPSVISFSEV